MVVGVMGDIVPPPKSYFKSRGGRNSCVGGMVILMREAAATFARAVIPSLEAGWLGVGEPVTRLPVVFGCDLSGGRESSSVCGEGICVM